uniref:DUF7789 domain-containing protein n=1 Tax=Nothobranchius kuhntae TaxID=321403 RepID=A0A1A8IL61_NOTKU
MDERSSLLDNQQQQNPDLLSPNLRPRHPNLIPTPCGPIKSWSELSVLVRLYFCFTLASLLALLGVTSSSIYKQHMNTDVSDEDNFTVSLIQLIGIWFCIYYISRGVLQENRQELVAFVLSVLGVMIRSVVNFSVVGSKGKQELLVVENWFQNKTYTLEAAAVTGALFSLVIKAVLLWGLVRLVHSFGQGLRERMFASRP